MKDEPKPVSLSSFILPPSSLLLSDPQRLRQFGEALRLLLVVADQLAELIAADLEERFREPRVELRTRAAAEFRQRDLQRQRLAIGAARRHRVEAVCEANDPTHQWDV